MTTVPELIFLDTNVYLIGAVDLNSYEGQILQWLGWETQGNDGIEVVISDELIDQILPYGRYLWGNEGNRFETAIGQSSFEIVNTIGEDDVPFAIIFPPCSTCK